MKKTDKEIVNIAMRNSYAVLFEGAKEEDIMESDNYYFAHNPFAPYGKEFLSNMLQFFIEEEEYEKCIIIRKSLKQWNSDPTKKKL
tara:strand:- start:190 stop:447 length:258 start_codon:yes stop_codon:yes gene_type:complete